MCIGYLLGAKCYEIVDISNLGKSPAHSSRYNTLVVSLNYTVDGSPTPVVVLRSNQLVHIRLRVGVGHYIINVNKLMSNYSSLQSHVLIKLFQNSCCSFYGATLWNFNTSVYESLCVAWNKALRRVWRLPYNYDT